MHTSPLPSGRGSRIPGDEAATWHPSVNSGTRLHATRSLHSIANNDGGDEVTATMAMGVAFSAWALMALGQWWVLRQRHRRELATLQQRHRMLHEQATQMLMQARQQIGTLQHELAAARMNAKPAPAPVRTAPSLSIFEDDDPARWPSLPANGFADTQPMHA